MATTVLQPLVSEIFVGSWTNVTSMVERDNGTGIRIDRKALTWAERTGNLSASWTFKNPNNDFYGRNPNSAYYGLLGRNTEVRHRLLLNNNTFTSAVASAWPDSITGQVWTNTGGSASDYSSSGGFGRHTHTSVNVIRASTVEADSSDQDITVDVKWDLGSATGANVGHWVGVRYTDASNHYIVRLSLTTTGTVELRVLKRVAGVLTGIDDGALEVDSAHVSGDWWTIRVSLRGKRIRVMTWPQGTTPPRAWQFSIAADDDTLNVSTGTKVSCYSRLEAGNTNTLNVIAYWDNFQINNYRFWGEIPSFTPQRDGTQRMRTVPVTAAGLSQRLGQGTPSLRSALTRTMDGIAAGSDVVPVSHWSMEDETGTGQFGNMRAGGPAVISGSVSPSSYTGAAGSDAVPILNNGGQIAGVFPPQVLEPDGTGRFIWQIQALIMLPSSISGDAYMMDIYTSDTNGDHVTKLRVHWDQSSSTLEVIPFDRTGASLPFSGIIVDSEYMDVPLLLGLNLYNPTPGGSVALQIGIFSPTLAPNTLGVSLGTGATSIVPVPQSWRAYAGANNAGWSISHLAYYTDPALFDLTNQQDNADAIDGFTGEAAGVRMLRVAREEDIPFEVLGDETLTSPCGPQRSGSVLSVFTEAANADQGILLDARDILGLQYIPRVELENTSTALTIDYAAGQLNGFQVVDDDRTVRNVITSRRIGGSFATAEITSGPTSTSPAPDGIGPYPEDMSWNLAADVQLLSFAGWRAHIKGWDEARYPGTIVWRERDALQTDAVLDSAVLNLDIATRYVIENPPEDLPPNDIELLAQGYVELIANFEHQISVDGQPAGPYTVFETDTDGARSVSEHFLRTGVDTSATAWQIGNTEAGVQIIADDAEDGWIWDINGEYVQVTNVTPPTIAFVGVGTASTGSAGSRTPGLPASIAAGHLALIFASTRNTAGSPDTPANWEMFYRQGNVAVFGRIYDGVWTMPTVTFTGGAANEDTIAQSAAFSGCFHDPANIFVRVVGCLNTSAQDITVSGMSAVGLPVNCMGLYLGWKQDDFTSVAQPASWTEMQEASSTAGNDASQVWGYQQFTSRPAVGSLQPALVVTGGASAISRGVVLIFASDYQNVTVVRGINGISKEHDVDSIPQLIPAPHFAM